MKYLRLLSVIFLIIIILAPSLITQASPPIPPGDVSGPSNELEEAILDAFKDSMKSYYAISVFEPKVENIQFATDLTWATAWIVMTNPQTNEVVPSEPTPTLAHWDGKAWIVFLPSDEGWVEAIESAPAELVSNETLSTWLIQNEPQSPAQITAAISGYLLPWEGGKTVYLSRSVAHDQDITSGNAHHSFDFYVPQTMFNIHAAKSGTVWLYKDDIANNDHDSVNYLVLQDTTTNPVTYQLYLHLAQGSIPPSLKSIGAVVTQGQFIGVADNTGQSTGHHLHFQVQSEPYWTYWGRSVDIIFSDVDINGGRPRVAVDFPFCTWAGDVCSVSRSSYTSSNYPQPTSLPPYGDTTSPSNGSVLQQASISLSGWATDPDGSIASARFIARYDTTWQQVGPAFSISPFTYNWDVCSGQVPDGPLSLALQIQDSNGNWASGLPGLRHIIKDFTCPPPPTCTPSASQIAVYADPSYQGNCVLFSQGSYTNASSFGAVGVDNVASVKVGANVIATLYLNSNLSGRGEAFSVDDSNLKENLIGSDTVSSLRVQMRSDLPSIPVQTWPENGTSFPWYTSQSLVWDNGGGALEYQVELDGVAGSWQSVPYAHLGSAITSTHNWRVRAKNSTGVSNWSSMRSFTVGSLANAPNQPTLDAPFSDDMENGYNNWTASSNWDQSLDGNHTPGGRVIWKYEVNAAPIGYDNGIPNSGDLTSPQITIPTSGYYLRFWYLYETEGPGIHWDQRWVQISVNNSSFTNLYQLNDDPENVWLQSPIVDVSAYAGSTIRIRFHFETLDAAFNTKKGWFIDDFSIATTPPPSCSATGEPDNTPTQARSIAQNTSLAGIVCPGGDVDVYKFTASGTGKTGIAAAAQSSGSPLDTMIFLLDGDGRSELAGNDDQVAYTRTDSYINADLVSGKTYYIKLRAWDHPSVGDNTHFYTMNLYGEDLNDPVAAITSPPESTFLPLSTLSIQVSASDDLTGISHVEFLWHSGDWQNGNWISFGEDWEAQDGWSYNFDTLQLTEQTGIAFLARVYDWAGNRTDTAIWNMAIDRTPPVTSIQSVQLSQTSSLVRVNWSGADNLSGIDHFDLEQQTDGGTFQSWLSGLPADRQQAWFAGTPGHSYGFRIRGVDRLGNVEGYPASADVSTTIPASVCSAGDQWENDNSSSAAKVISGVSETRLHNFCNPAQGAGWMNDQDWLRFTVPTGKTVFIHATSQDNGVAAILQLYAANGTTLLREALPAGLGQPSHLFWTTSQNTTYYLRIFPLYGRITGDGTTYQLYILQGNSTFLPNIRK